MERPLATDVVWLDGQLTTYAEARVSAEDRGFVFGDGVYEVIRIYAGRPFALDRHLARFERSAAGILIDLPRSRAALVGLVGELVARAGLAEAEVYMQLTRGAARRNHPFPEGVAPTLLVGVRDLRAMPPGLWAEGCQTITRVDDRWAHCDLKAIGLLPNVLAKEAARRAGALEALYLRDGLLTEGASANVGCVIAGRFVTPRADWRVLPGITRAIALEVARDLGIAVEERDVSAGELASVEEAFLLSTRVEVLPIAAIDGRAVGNGQPGPITRAIAQGFRARVVAETSA